MIKNSPEAFKNAALALCIVVVVVGCTGGEELAVYEEAEKRLSEGRYHQAADAYSRFVETYPASPLAAPSLYRKGLIYSLHLDDPARAMEVYSSLFYMYPDSDEVVLARTDRARIFSEGGDHFSAVEEYHWLMDRVEGGERDVFHMKVAEEYVQMSDFSQARVELEEMLAASPGTPLAPEAHLQIAHTLYLEGSLKEAASVYETVAAEYKDHPTALDARLAVAVVMEEMGSHEEALTLLKVLEKEYPNKGVIKIRIASTEERQKDGPGSKKKKSKKKK